MRVSALDSLSATAVSVVRRNKDPLMRTHRPSHCSDARARQPEAWRPWTLLAGERCGWGGTREATSGRRECQQQVLTFCAEALQETDLLVAIEDGLQRVSEFRFRLCYHTTKDHTHARTHTRTHTHTHRVLSPSASVAHGLEGPSWRAHRPAWTAGLATRPRL
jgi:hypothetical protein